MSRLRSHTVIINATLFFIAALVLVSIGSCRVSSKSAKIKEEKKPEDKSAPDLQSLIEENSFKASSVVAKASVKVFNGDEETSFNINMRLLTDSAVWLSISPMLGIEVARVLITRDSVKFLDRLSNRYSVTDFNYLNDLFKINIDFDIIQGVLTGNFFAYKKNKFNSVYLEDRYYILSTLSKKKLKRSLEDIDINKPIVQDMWVDATSYRITRLSIEDQRTNKTLQTQYTDHRVTDGGLFPFHSSTIIITDKQVRVEIDFSRVTLNDKLTFPFTIPSGYEKIY